MPENLRLEVFVRHVIYSVLSSIDLNIVLKMNWKYVTKNNFFDAVHNGVWKAFIDTVVDAGFDISSKKSTNGCTVLSFAAEYGDREIVEYLVQKGAKVNVKNGDGTIPLHIAAKHSHKDVVEFLVNSGMLVDIRDKRNRTPLHYVAETFHRQQVEPYTWDNGRRSYSNVRASKTCPASDFHMELGLCLLSHGADFDATDGNGDVPLLLAAKYSCVEVVKMLLLFGANVKSLDKQKWTVMHYASLNGWLSVLQSLVGRGCDVNPRNCSGDSPVMFSLLKSPRAIFELLVESGASLEGCDSQRRTVLHHACRRGWLDVVHSLVESGFDINAKASYGYTPLLFAAKHSHKVIVEMLFKLGAHLESSDWKSWTLLHYSCRSGWLDIVKFLLEAGFDINVKTWDCETPLFLSAKFSHFDIFHHLIEAGADINVKIFLNSLIDRKNEGYETDGGEAFTLLHHASYKGWLNVLLSLIQVGVDINQKTSEGDTALHLAVKMEYFEIAKHLLNAGADCNIENDDDETAFQYLIKNDLVNAETIRLFIENGSCIHYDEYKSLSECAFFKEDILRDAKICTQAVINVFNNVDLVEVYEEAVAVEYLPPIERMRMRSHGSAAHSIEQTVRHEIETNGYCNILEVHPIVLSLIAAKSFIERHDSDSISMDSMN